MAEQKRRRTWVIVVLVALGLLFVLPPACSVGMYFVISSYQKRAIAEQEHQETVADPEELQEAGCQEVRVIVDGEAQMMWVDANGAPCEHQEPATR